MNMASSNTVIHADSLGELQGKSIGYNHDRCKTLYFGETKHLKYSLRKLFREDFKHKYVAIFEEHFPLLNIT